MQLLSGPFVGRSFALQGDKNVAPIPDTEQSTVKVTQGLNVNIVFPLITWLSHECLLLFQISTQHISLPITDIRGLKHFEVMLIFSILFRSCDARAYVISCHY